MTDLTKAFGQHAPRTGEFMRTPEQIAKDNRAAELRSMGWSYQHIGESMGMTKQGAHLAVKRAVAEIPKEGAEAVLKMELAKLDRVERYYNSVLAKTHIRVGNTGKIVVDEKGEALIDEQPRMAAADGLLKTSTQRAKLLGLNAPTSIKGELIVYDVDRDSTKIIEAQLEALRAMGLHDRVDEFRDQFLAALGGGQGEVIDAEWSSETLAVPGSEL